MLCKIIIEPLAIRGALWAPDFLRAAKRRLYKIVSAANT